MGGHLYPGIAERDLEHIVHIEAHGLLQVAGDLPEQSRDLQIVVTVK